MNSRAAAAVLIGCFAALAIGSSRTHSNAYDELAYVGAGYSYVASGNFSMDGREHPPLYKTLAGLALTPLRLPMPRHQPWERENAYQFGQRLLYGDGSDPMRALQWARLPNFLAALGLGVCVFLWSKRMFGVWPGLTALGLYCFEPTLIAHASLVSLDLGVAAFGFLAVMLFEARKKTGSAVSLALASLTKLSAVLFIPSIALSAALSLRRRKDFKKYAADLALFCGVTAAIVITATAAARTGALLVESIVYRAGELAGRDAGGPATNFLMGQTRLGGFLSYYVVALAVKCTIPFLLMVLAGALAWRKMTQGRDRWPWLLFPVLFFLLAGSISQKQFGIRYVLPVFPFLCVAASATACRPRARALVGALLLWHAAEGLMAAPHFHAYFNEAAGGMSGGHRWLADSSLDWGQDMPLLREYLSGQGPAEKISLISTDADLDYWIGDHQDLFADVLTASRPYEHVNSTGPARELLLVSAMFKSGWGLSDPQAFAWLGKLKPAAVLAGSIFVYDVTSDAWAHNRMGFIYYRLKQWPLALRECRRAAELAPNNREVYAAWANVYQAMGDTINARKMRARVTSEMR